MLECLAHSMPRVRPLLHAVAMGSQTASPLVAGGLVVHIGRHRLDLIIIQGALPGGHGALAVLHLHHGWEIGGHTVVWESEGGYVDEHCCVEDLQIAEKISGSCVPAA